MTHPDQRIQSVSLLGLAFAALTLVLATSANASTVATGTNVAVATTATASAMIGGSFHGSIGFGGRYGYRHHGYYGYRSHYGYRGSYGYYRPYYRHYGYGYGPSRYGYGGYWRGEGRGGEALGAIDLNVKPSKAEVFLDGKYIGVADQYDGFPSYLWLEEGVYTLTLYKDGYQTVSREIAIQPDLSIDLRERLVKGESTRPEQPAPPAEKVVAPTATGGDPGRLTISVAPDDAVIYLDGHFYGVASELAHVRSGLPIEAGEHTIEIVRPGYRTVERVIEIGAGESVSMEETLRPR
jgi:hypothetical protein